MTCSLFSLWHALTHEHSEHCSAHIRRTHSTSLITAITNITREGEWKQKSHTQKTENITVFPNVLLCAHTKCVNVYKRYHMFEHVCHSKRIRSTVADAIFVCVYFRMLHLYDFSTYFYNNIVSIRHIQMIFDHRLLEIRYTHLSIQFKSPMPTITIPTIISVNIHCNSLLCRSVQIVHPPPPLRPSACRRHAMRPFHQTAQRAMPTCGTVAVATLRQRLWRASRRICQQCSALDTCRRCRCRRRAAQPSYCHQLIILHHFWLLCVRMCCVRVFLFASVCPRNIHEFAESPCVSTIRRKRVTW